MGAKMELLEFFKSDVGVAIAWVCTVIGTGFSVFVGGENRKLKSKIKLLEVNVGNMGDDTVNQSGKTNIYTKQNSGDMNINM
ncbi:Bacteriophage protein [Pseudomonas chlororaphis]